VVFLEKRVDPLPGAAGILVNRQGHINRGDELASLAPRFAEDLLHLGPLLVPAAEVGLVGEPAIEMPSGTLEGGADGAGHPDRRAAGAVWGRPQDAALHRPAPLPVDRLPGPQGSHPPQAPPHAPDARFEPPT